MRQSLTSREVRIRRTPTNGGLLRVADLQILGDRPRGRPTGDPPVAAGLPDRAGCGPGSVLADPGSAPVFGRRCRADSADDRRAPEKPAKSAIVRIPCLPSNGDAPRPPASTPSRTPNP